MGKRQKKRRRDQDRKPIQSRRRRGTLRKRLQIDMHSHTLGSDGRGTVQTIVEGALDAGLDGLALTDHHNTITEEGQQVAQALREMGLLCIVGCEYSTHDGHLLVYGIDVQKLRFQTARDAKGNMTPGGRFYPDMAEVLYQVREAGGFAAPSHPYRGYRQTLGDQIYQLAACGLLTAAETHNGQNEWMSPTANPRAQEAAQELSLACLGGSDAHTPEHLGAAFTVYPEGCRTEGDVLEALRAHEFEARFDPEIIERAKRAHRANPPEWLTHTRRGWQEPWLPGIIEPSPNSSDALSFLDYAQSTERAEDEAIERLTPEQALLVQSGDVDLGALLLEWEGVREGDVSAWIDGLTPAEFDVFCAAELDETPSRDQYLGRDGDADPSQIDSRSIN